MARAISNGVRRGDRFPPKIIEIAIALPLQGLPDTGSTYLFAIFTLTKKIGYFAQGDRSFPVAFLASPVPA
ncbi:hypothetical protein [Puniceicoccus vermicola]|uniref:Uncharacterized protein n=1 Tax=Puniceicoccus vermicola TaxID=388746 RepID=A0A7X1B217_9BACT|nr:hypothetical protein [Puniceicoccus vermicola]MBC2604171.1 hypothetical protein [Puniceicoccus vermicola]